MSPARTMLPVPRDSVASQECVEENPIVETHAYEYTPKTNSPSHAYEYAPKTKSGERTDGPVTELAEKPELAGHSEGGGEERRGLLSYTCVVNVGARGYIAP